MYHRAHLPTEWFVYHSSQKNYEIFKAKEFSGFLGLEIFLRKNVIFAKGSAKVPLVLLGTGACPAGGCPGGGGTSLLGKTGMCASFG